MAGKSKGNASESTYFQSTKDTFQARTRKGKSRDRKELF